MNMRRCLRQSLTAITANRLRTGLTMLALAVGVATLVVMVGLGQGASRTMLAQIQRMGSDLLTVRAAQERKLTQRERQFSQVTTLRPADATAIAGLAEVKAAVPACIRTLRVKWGELSTTTKVVGATAEFPSVRSFSLQNGRFFDDAENRAGLRVGVIGSDLREKLFGDRDPIGERVRVGRVPIEIIGTFAQKGQSRDGANEDDLLVIPARTALRRVLNIRHLDVIYVHARNHAALNAAEASVRELLRGRHRLDSRRLDDDFSISNQAALLDTAEETRRSFTLLIVWTAGIALVVGGFGILAIMLLSVRERTPEIGLRLAVGARRRDILLQFLIEALALAAGGGLAGVVLGAISCLVAQYHLGLAAQISAQTVSLAVLCSVTTGLIFGVLPVRQASRLSPVAALDMA